MIQFVALHKQATADHLGLLPSFLDAENPQTAKEQLHQNYQHGGGWSPFVGHTLDRDNLSLHYPGDPPLRALACAKLRKELIVVYEASWVAIIQPDGSYEVCRMD